MELNKNIDISSLGVMDLKKIVQFYPWFSFARENLLYKTIQIESQSLPVQFKDNAIYFHKRGAVLQKCKKIIAGELIVDVTETNEMDWLEEYTREQQSILSKNISTPEKADHKVKITYSNNNFGKTSDAPVTDVIGDINMTGHKQFDENINKVEQSLNSTPVTPKNLTEKLNVDTSIISHAPVDISLSDSELAIDFDEIKNKSFISNFDENLDSQKKNNNIVEVKDMEPIALDSKTQFFVVGGDYFSKNDFDSLKEEEKAQELKIGTPAAVNSTIYTAPAVEENNFDSPNFYTETLAKIYEQQGYYEKAIEVYAKLILLYPEKSTYFASLVKEIKSKI